MKDRWIQIRVDRSLKEALVEAAASRGISLSQLMLDAAREYIEDD